VVRGDNHQQAHFKRAQADANRACVQDGYKIAAISAEPEAAE